MKDIIQMKQKQTTLAELRLSSREKRQTDDALLVILLRPISDLISLFMIKCSVSANAVTYFNYVLSLISLYLICLGDFFILMGLVGLIFWQMLDIIDGTIARVTNNLSVVGGCIDHLIGIHVSTLLPFSMGVGIYNSQGLANYVPNLAILSASQVWLVAGGVTGFVFLLLRFSDLYLNAHLTVDKYSNFRCGSMKTYGVKEMGIFVARQVEYVGGGQILIWISAYLFAVLELTLIFYFFLSLIFYVSYFVIFFRSKENV